MEDMRYSYWAGNFMKVRDIIPASKNCYAVLLFLLVLTHQSESEES